MGHSARHWVLLLNGERCAPSLSILVAFTALSRSRTVNIRFAAFSAGFADAFLCVIMRADEARAANRIFTVRLRESGAAFLLFVRESWVLLLNGERCAPSLSILVAFTALMRIRRILDWIVQRRVC
jgi:hypothetical protein